MRYIDADKLQEEFKELHCGKRSLLIDTEPTADVRENVKGEWLPHPNKDFREWDVCSACGIGCKRREYDIHANGKKWVTEYNYPFCPNCGADMRRKDNER